MFAMQTKRLLGVLAVVSVMGIMLFSTSCSDEKEHRHSVLPGSEFCDVCGKQIVICEDCSMVNDSKDNSCWFCKSELN